jgi:lipoprotein-releasing system permease protein
MIGFYPLGLALRYLGGRRGDGFISFISLVSTVGIGLGVAVLIVVLSVMNGFEEELKDRILSVSAHATVTGYTRDLDDWPGLRSVAMGAPGVLNVAPYIEAQGLLVAGERQAGVGFRGVDPTLEAGVSRLHELLNDGTMEALQPGSYNMVLGASLADHLGVQVGDSVVLVVPKGSVTPAGLLPRMRRFYVAGIFEAGMYEFDRGLALIALADAGRLLRSGDRVTGLRLAVADVFAAGSIARDVALRLGGGLYVSDWTRRHVNFFRSIALTKSIMFVLLLLIIGVAAFNIISTLVMVVRDKRPDIAILRTMGAKPISILMAFAIQGTLIGTAGTLLGVGLGWLLAGQLGAIVARLESVFSIDLLAADVYFLSDLPTRVDGMEVAQIAALALVLSILATIYPALRAARTDPAEALRHD